MNFAAIPAELRRAAALGRLALGRASTRRPASARSRPYCPTDLRRHGSSHEPGDVGDVRAGGRRRRSGQGRRDRVRARAALRRRRPRRGAPGGRPGSGRARARHLHRAISLRRRTSRRPQSRPERGGRHPKGSASSRTTGSSTSRATTSPARRRRSRSGRPSSTRCSSSSCRSRSLREIHLAPSRQPVDLDDQRAPRAHVRLRTATVRRPLGRPLGARYASQSEADLALCSHLAFWTGRTRARIDRLFRSSGLYREESGTTRRLPRARRSRRRSQRAARYRPPSERSRGSDSVDSVAAF